MSIRWLAQLTRGNVYRDLTIPGYPHRYDLYVPRDVTIAGALVILHGGGGTKERIARQVGLTKSSPPNDVNVRWSVLQNFGVVVVIPQGQYCSGITNDFNPNGADTRSANNPQGVPAWSNFDFWSQVDDELFLYELGDRISLQYGLAGVNLAGFSTGAMMCQRLYQSNDIRRLVFRRFLSLAGPRPLDCPLDTPASLNPRPLFCQFGGRDENLQTYNGLAGPGDHFYDPIWYSENYSVAMYRFPGLPQRFGAFADLQNIVDRYNNYHSLPAETVAVGDGVVSTPGVGTRTRWTYNNGATVLELFSLAEHSPPTIAQGQAARIINIWLGFCATTPVLPTP